MERLVVGKRNPKEYLIYTQEEANEAEIQYTDWRVAEAGKWALTDDGFVVECLKHSQVDRPKKSCSSRYMTFSIGTAVHSTSLVTGDSVTRKKLEWSVIKHIPVPTWDELEVKRRRTKRAVDFYTDLFIAKDGRLTSEDYHNCGVMYRPKEKIPEATFRRLLRAPAVDKLVMDTLKAKLINKGITADNVLDMFMETYDAAKDASHTNVMRSVAKDLMDLIEKAEGPVVEESSEFDFKRLDARIEDEMLLTEGQGYTKQLEEGK